jgi:hypothetical protein
MAQAVRRRLLTLDARVFFTNPVLFGIYGGQSDGGTVIHGKVIRKKQHLLHIRRSSLTN